ncbi:MAG: phosphatidate cytidylyltransferase [Halieaceae bacterium]|jgi:phosphatidate cytidylyltransferase
MLRQRVVTAVFMAAAFLAGAYWLPLPALAAIFAVLIGMGAWEWAPLAGLVGTRPRVLYTALMLCSAAALYGYAGFGDLTAREHVQPVLGLACLWWCFALLWVKSFPASAGLWSSRFTRSLMGVLILVPAWFAAVYLLHIESRGAVMVVLMLLVAAADIGAYFTGKAFGRHALSPRVSPGKTWEGFWGGVVCVALLSALLWSLLPDRFEHLSLPAAMIVALATAFASVLGDLTVSMVKRASGVKDTSSLLPGHGGLLDRLDSVCAAAPTFALGLLLVGF